MTKGGEGIIPLTLRGVGGEGEDNSRKKRSE